MSNIVPCLTSIECRWKPEVVQRPDVVQMADGRYQDVTRPVELSQELKIRFDWYEGSESRFYQVFTWGAEKIPAVGPLLERVAASTLIGKDSIFEQVAKDLYALCKTELDPVVESVPYAIQTYVPAKAVSNLKVYLPYDKPRERVVEIETIHYLDNKFTQQAFKKGKRWLSRDVITEQKLEGETACEELLNNEAIEPHVVECIKKCAELVKGVYTTFAIDVDTWINLAQATIDSYNPQPAE